ncbi:hypothetical protein MNBD_GAMMA22-2524 [hydrothermal vent metagenome]|uniref:ATP-grasp domain-containing protein n=1 Tax=hydrothermal vent metagenome TaxID=652676 RepID=A0A3B0ZX15_9ZZZZ
MKYINKVIRLIRKMILCMRPYNGFRNRKIFKSFSGFQRDFYIKYWAEASSAIGASLDDVGYGCFKITKGNKKTYVRNFNVMLDDNLTLNIAGNKPFVLNILKEHNFQIPKFLEYKLQDIIKAQAFLESLGKSAVVKPASGTGAGRGVTTHINDITKLHKASNFASSYCETLLIEEQVEGDSFRLLYIEGEFIDALRRDPPIVIGDGQSTIKQLIRQENNKRINSDEILTFHPLIIDMECKLKLKEQGLTIKSVLDRNQKIIVKTVVNQNSCFENHVVRDTVHPSLILTGQKIVNELGITLGGIDVITTDISIPLQESGGIINEINTTPGLHHHSLVFEKDKILPVGEMVLNYIFSNK